VDGSGCGSCWVVGVRVVKFCCWDGMGRGVVSIIMAGGSLVVVVLSRSKELVGDVLVIRVGLSLDDSVVVTDMLVAADGSSDCVYGCVCFSSN
jgi:hypothetical protein